MLANLTTEDIKVLLFKLPKPELLNLMAEVQERLDTDMIMKLAETAFDKWNDPEEDSQVKISITPLKSEEKTPLEILQAIAELPLEGMTEFVN